MITTDNNTTTLTIESLNLGNNFTFEHLTEAIKENSEAMEDVEKLNYIDLSNTFKIKANLNFGYTLDDEIDLHDFLQYFEE